MVRLPHARPTARSLSFMLLVLASVIAACGSNDEASGGKDAATTCKDLCTAATFTGSRVDTQPNEINCFCSSGTGTVSAAACTNMCSSIGKAKSQAFKSAGGNIDSCQCS